MCGRLVTAALVDRMSDMQCMLRVEAKPFIPDSLRHLFDARPPAFAKGLNPLLALLEGQQVVVDFWGCGVHSWCVVTHWCSLVIHLLWYDALLHAGTP